MDVPEPELREAEALVQRHFGYAGLREGQAETIARVRRGEDVLAVMPTGGGKSICYQLPAVLGKRVTLVVSPLVALMKDQLDGLPAPMRAAATSVTGELSGRDLRDRYEEIARGRYRLVYAAPERLRQPAMLRALRRVGVERLVVDEAHCVSTWGPDFRPDYLALPQARAALGSPPVLAVTATAPPRVLADIQARLGPLTLVRASVRRPNLRLEAILAKDADEKLAHLLQLCKETPAPGIVYASSRVKTEQLAAALQAAGVNAAAYHAGMPERGEIQERFMRNEIDVLVATIAFGMGVDKGDIRFVFHHDPSGSLEAYYQEAGRAGRDGQAARCVLVATGADGGTLKARAKSDLPSLDLVGAVWSLIVAGVGDDQYSLVDAEQLDALSPDDDVKARVALSVLVEGGAAQRLPDAPRFLEWRGRERTLVDVAQELGVAPAEVEATLLARDEPFFATSRAILLKVTGRPESAERVLEAMAQRAQQRGELVMQYVRVKECRHAFILRHFGEEGNRAPGGASGHTDVPCGACDVCIGIEHRVELAEDDEQAAKLVLVALSGIRGIGETNLVYMLRGDPLAPPWTDGKPGAGSLGFRSASKVKAIVRGLETRGLIERETLAHGGVTLKLSAAGSAALGGASRLLPEMRREAQGARREPTAPRERAAATDADAPLPLVTPLDASAQPLFDALKAWRRETADAEGVPAYVVAHDSMIRAVAEARPTSPAQLRGIKGFGPKKLEKYGEAILRIVEDHLRSA